MKSPEFVMSCVAFLLIVGTAVLAFELGAGAYVWIHLAVFGGVWLWVLVQHPLVRVALGRTSRSLFTKKG